MNIDTKHLNYLRYNAVLCGSVAVKSMAVNWGLANRHTEYFPLPSDEVIENKIVVGPISYRAASKALANIRFHLTLNSKLVTSIPKKDANKYEEAPFLYIVSEEKFPDPDEIDLIATRHKGLRDFFIANGFALEETPCFRPRFPGEVYGKTVLGILPFDMAGYTKRYARIDVNIPRDKRGIEFSAEELEKFPIGNPECYKVIRMTPARD